MRCTYCEVEIVNYPDSGICPHCGGRLPPRPAGRRCPVCGNYSTGNFCAVCGQNLTGAQPRVQPQAQPQAQTVYVAVPQGPLVPGRNCCPKCHSTQLLLVKRGFRWGLGIFGFILLPVIGILWGFSGSRKLWRKCSACGHKWKPF